MRIPSRSFAARRFGRATLALVLLAGSAAPALGLGVRPGPILARVLAASPERVLAANPERVLAAAPSTLDLNSASVQELIELPGIGESKASAIVALREERGGFRSVEELLDVKGIGPKALEKLRPHVKLGKANP